MVHTIARGISEWCGHSGDKDSLSLSLLEILGGAVYQK